MQAVFCKDVADRMVRIYQKLKPKLNDPYYHDRWIKLLRYTMTSSKYMTQENFAEVKNQMSDTDVITISPLAQELRAEGRKEGEAKTILRILTKFFGDVPPTVRDRLYAIHDLDVLGQLTDVALDCESLAEFEVALNK
jgi:hypothetical protein